MYEALFLHFIKVYRAMDGLRWAKVSAFTAKEKSRVRGGIAPFEAELALKKELERVQRTIQNAWDFIKIFQERENFILSFVKDFLLEMTSIIEETKSDLFAGRYR